MPRITAVIVKDRSQNRADAINPALICDLEHSTAVWYAFSLLRHRLKVLEIC